MKYFLFFCFAAMMFRAQGQDTAHHFHLEEGRIVWQFSFDSTQVPSNYLAFLKQKGIFEQVKEEPSQISGEFKETPILYKAAGYSSFVAPIIMIRHHVKGYATVVFRDGYYTITLRNIMLVRMSGSTEKDRPLEEDETRNGKMKWLLRNDNGEILSVTFRSVFGEWKK